MAERRWLLVPLLLVVAVLAGCAGIADTGLSGAFVDPAKYDYMECDRLLQERRSLTNQIAELQGLMAKAETGVGGSFVAETTYRPDYIKFRSQQKLLEEEIRRRPCAAAPEAIAAPAPPPAAPPVAKRR